MGFFNMFMDFLIIMTNKAFYYPCYAKKKPTCTWGANSLMSNLPQNLKGKGRTI